ncbi:HRDC domain-containing protein [Candidatus Woesearchaeota archaeon]|nr:HRDC domain-containing protein [Candidatus Woesearchaeota archaeon]
MEDGKKFDVEFKQTTKGSWYVGSLKVSADDVEELDRVIDSAVTFLHTRIDKMNKSTESRVFKPAGPPSIELNDEEKILFEKLRSMRMDLAKAENLPPYIIAHDSVLKKLAKAKPLTKEEMISIGGIGEKNFDKYGVYFLKVIRSSSLGLENGR